MAQVGIEFGHILALGNGADYDTEVGGLDALHQTAQTTTLFGTLDFLRDGNAVDEGIEHQITASKGEVAREFGTLGGDGLLGHLAYNELADFENVGQVAHFLKGRFDFEVVEVTDRGVTVHGQFHVLGQRIVVDPQIEVVDKAVLVLTHIDEGGIEPRHDFAHLADVNVADMDFVAGLVLVQFDQLLVFEKCKLDFAVGSGYD